MQVTYLERDFDLYSLIVHKSLGFHKKVIKNLFWILHERLDNSIYCVLNVIVIRKNDHVTTRYPVSFNCSRY